ncbi:MAG TPA: LacI family DNA-binding transcriptional regulator [Microlunatus sp.]
MTGSRAGRPATIADVASLAGVSPATVSRVMNGTRAVDEEMTDRVRTAARELDYSPSPLARSLVLGRTNTVAVVVPDLGNPTFHGVLRGLSRAAAGNGYHVLVADSAESVIDELALARQTRRRCDGVVLVAPRMAEEDLQRLLTSLQPVVLVNREPTVDTGSPVVTADYRMGLTGLLELLYEDGHRTLMYLAGAPQSASNTRRLAALESYRAAHADLTVEIRPCGVNFADGHDAASAVVAAGTTGVLAFNDLVAMGLISALTGSGIAVPEAVSVVGFDDIPFARYVTPPLTTAAVPVKELGEQAWLRMWDLLTDRPPGPTLVLSPHIVRRGSTGPAPHPAEVPRTGTANGP